MKGKLSRRFHSPRFLPRSLVVMQAVAATGIAIGAATLLVAIAIVSGFQREYRRSVLDFNAHVVILKAGEMEDMKEPISFAMRFMPTEDEKKTEHRYGWWLPYWNMISGIYHNAIDLHDDIAYKFETHPDFISLWEHLDPRLIGAHLPAGVRNLIKHFSDMERKGVVGVTPFLYREGLAISHGVIKGMVVKGIDPETVRDVNQMKIELPSGVSLKDALENNGKVPAIILGKALAERLGISTAPSSDETMTLMVPKTGKEKNFVSVKIAGIFESGLYDYDSQFALMSIDVTRRLFEAGAIKATGIEIKLDDPQKAQAVAAAFDDFLPAPYQALTWSELNRDLFAALSLEKFVFSIIMGILVIVAAFNIVGVLVLLISYRAHEVAILKALGMRAELLRKIFTRGGVVTGLAGTVAGVVIGLTLCLALKHYNFIRLEPEIYFLSTLPIDISWTICGMIGFFSVLMCYVTSRMAAKRLAQIPISEALKL